MEGYSYFIFDWLKSVLSYLIYDWVTLVFAALAVIPFAVLFIWSFCSKKMRRRPKTFYILTESVAAAFFGCYSLLVCDSLSEALFYPALLFGVVILFFFALYLQSKICVKLSDEERAEILKSESEEIDSVIEKCMPAAENKVNYDRVEYIRPAPVKSRDKEPVLNTTHLRELMNILYAYDLTLKDREAVKELNNLADSYDAGLITPFDKARLSDGINKLMGIMSRYN